MEGHGRGSGERGIIGEAAENGAWSGLEIDDHDLFTELIWRRKLA